MGMFRLTPRSHRDLSNLRNLLAPRFGPPLEARPKLMADRADRAARRRGKSAEMSDDSDGSTSDEGEPSELPMCTTHEKVHLEVTDSQHRYAKHLRMYHREWESRGSVGSFWDWIDAEPLVTMPDCPRERLQECRVAYLYLPEERAPYIVEVHQGRFYHPENPGTGEERSPYSTGEGEWIFVFSSARVTAALSQEPEHFLRPLPFAPARMPLHLRPAGAVLPPQDTRCLPPHLLPRGRAVHRRRHPRHSRRRAGGALPPLGPLPARRASSPPAARPPAQSDAPLGSAPAPAPVPAQGVLAALGGPALPMGEAGPLGAQPRPQVFERAASKAADATAVCPPGPSTIVRGQPRQRQRRRAASVQGAQSGGWQAGVESVATTRRECKAAVHMPPPRLPQQPRACAPRQVARADGNGTKKHTTMTAPATATLVPPARSTRRWQRPERPPARLP